MLVCLVNGLVHEYDLSLNYIGAVKLAGPPHFYPWHAVRITPGDADARDVFYAVTSEHAIGVASARNELYVYGDRNRDERWKRGKPLQDPRELVRLGNGNYLVADFGNDRVVVLSESLKLVRVLPTPVDGGLTEPLTLCFDELSSTLWVGALNNLLKYDVSGLPEFSAKTG